MIRATFTLRQGWGAEFSRRINRVVEEELGHASKTGAAVASSIAATRSRSGTMADMELLEVEGNAAAGWDGGFRSKAWYAGFQNKGTSRGIVGLHFLEKGRTAARKQLVDRLNRLS